MSIIFVKTDLALTLDSISINKSNLWYFEINCKETKQKLA